MPWVQRPRVHMGVDPKAREGSSTGECRQKELGTVSERQGREARASAQRSEPLFLPPHPCSHHSLPQPFPGVDPGPWLLPRSTLVCALPPSHSWTGQCLPQAWSPAPS